MITHILASVFNIAQKQEQEETMWAIVQSIINGLLAGGVYALIAVGVTIIFGVMRLVNFANGAFMVLGMYFSWFYYSLFGLNCYETIPLVIISCAVVGYLSFKLTLVPILNKNRQAGLMITVGLSYIIQNVLIIVFGSNPMTLPSELSSKSVKIGSFVIGLPRLISFGIAIVLIIAVSILVEKTRFGKQMRATSENVAIAEILGIKTNLVFALSWTLGIVLIGVAGAALTPLYYVQTSLATIFRNTPIIAVVLGGLGSIPGAFLAGLLLGVIEALVSTIFSADLGPLGIFLAYLIVFYMKPRGLFGKGERIA